MKSIRWSKLYPQTWQEQFGEEFDEMNSMRGVRAKDVLDIAFHALALRLSGLVRALPFLGAWIVVCFLNVCAKEVQWAAGALVICSAGATAMQPKKWLRNAFGFFVAIPISSLYLYQDASTKHAPLYQTAVAFIPALVGALFGLAIGSSIGSRSNPRVS